MRMSFRASRTEMLIHKALIRAWIMSHSTARRSDDGPSQLVAMPVMANRADIVRIWNQMDEPKHATRANHRVF
jgi:hypothetical protein